MSKIRVEELSIGDWLQARMVRWDYEDLDITPPMRVAEISSDEVMLQLGSVKHYAFVDDLQPIPITAEVLEKNGWKLSKSNWFEFEDGEWKINIWIGKSKCNIEISQKREIYAFTYADIQVVKSNINTLQHALRLAGVDKEITL